MRAAIETTWPEHISEFIIALHTGMRPSEQYRLTWDMIDLARKQVAVMRSKNGRPRHIGLNVEALAAFQRVFAMSDGQRRGRVFTSSTGDPLKGYRHWFDRAVRDAGLTGFTWYCLRHTFASRLVMAGIDLRTVADLMGHKTIQMTMRYAHLAPEHNLQAVERLVTTYQLSTNPTAERDGQSSAADSTIGNAPDVRQGRARIQ